MRKPILLFVALLGLLSLPGSALGQGGDPPAGGTAEIRGRVLGRQGQRSYPLPHVMLDFSQGFLYRTVVTDSLGRYAVGGLAPGRWRVHALHVGHAGLALEVLVPSDGHVELEMELLARPIPLRAVVVRAFPVHETAPKEAASALAVGELSLRALEGTTGIVEAGLAQMVRSLPGNNEAEPTDVLFMRGSAADLKLVLLDGAPIYTPFHLGGVVESFDPGALGGASLFLGGAPARFDGGLSYILDLRTRAPRRDRLHVEVGADLLTGRSLIEGPFFGGGILLGSRMIHDLGAPALDRGESPYGYRDLLVRGQWGERGGTKAFVTGFWNREEVRLDLREVAPAEGASWGNQALTGGVSGVWGETLGEVRAAITRYDSQLPVADSIPLFARSRSDRMRITADLSHPLGEGVFRLGASLDALHTDFAAQGTDPQGVIVRSELALLGNSGGVYAEGTQPLGSNLSLRAGFRLDRFSGDGGLRAAPRAALSWLLAENAVLTLAAGRYHQFSALSSGAVEATLSEDPAPAASYPSQGTTQLSVGTANHLVVSLDQILAPGLRLGIEGYTKTFSGVTEASETQLNASGVDFRVARDGNRTSGWLGYTLTWFWASEGGFLGGDSRFSGRHLLSAGLSTRLSERTGVRLRVGYGDGLPYTSIPIAHAADGTVPVFDAGGGSTANRFELNPDNILNEAPGLAVGPDEGFLRVEGEIYGSWTTTLGGRSTQIRPYLRVLNALNRRDALFYHFDPWRNSTPRPLAELPVLPLLGVELIF
jgi:hypothetical protein